MKITVIGTGYVGLVAGTCFSNFGFEVNCIDNDIEKINALKNGIIPIFEPGLEELVLKNYKAEHLKFSTDKHLLDEATILIIAVGTPAAEDGNANMSYLDAVLDDIVNYVTTDKYIIIKSTVPIGTANRVKAILKEKRQNLKFSVISNPEFLREGSAVNDFFYPDRIIIGASDEEAKEVARKLYAPVIANDTYIEFTDNSTAEIIKYAANAFLAMKVSFINEISDLAEQFDANIEDVSNGIGSDKRIGKHFLKPGPGYGGSCFPKDTLALAKTASNSSTPSLIVNAVIESNNKRKTRMANRVITALNGNVEGKIITIFGLTFKAETDDMRDSASIDIINHLKENGAIIRAYDPKGLKEAEKIFGDSIEYYLDAFSAAKGAEAVCIVTEWAEFKTLDLQSLKKEMNQPLIVDFRNIFSSEDIVNTGFTYISLGKPKIKG